MPTYRLKSDGEILFFHVCSHCDEVTSASLLQGGWRKIRETEPVVCNECTRKCALTAQGLWGAEDEVRYAQCAACPGLTDCPLKGRYYC